MGSPISSHQSEEQVPPHACGWHLKRRTVLCTEPQLWGLMLSHRAACWCPLQNWLVGSKTHTPSDVDGGVLRT
jgi:hypothetical protein